MILERFAYLDDGVCGRLLFGGQEVYTVERPWLCNKVGESCIPEGDYALRPYSSARFTNVWEVCDVPGRTYILIHAANLPTEVEGCIAPGMSCRLPGSVGVNSSRKACGQVYEYLAAQWSEYKSGRGPEPRLQVMSAGARLEDCV